MDRPASEQQTDRLLAPDEPPPFTIERAAGASPFFLTCDHAGRRLPRRLGDLGLPAAELGRHIAWDIGAGAVTRLLAEALDAFAILQTYSRLVIDCNRDPSVETSIVTLSELTEVPGNRGLSEGERRARRREILEPYQDRTAEELDRRLAQGRPTVLIAVHSFTPVFKGVARPWHIGVLYHRDARYAQALKAELLAEGDLVVGDNEPYAVDDLSDYGIPVHGERRGIPHVEIEIRQDLIEAPAGQGAWAGRLARLLPAAWRRMSGAAA
jgi:predicted N-formylglutamate amidohydrolase